MGLGTTAYLGGASCSNRTHSHHAVISDQSDQLIVFLRQTWHARKNHDPSDVRRGRTLNKTYPRISRLGIDTVKESSQQNFDIPPPKPPENPAKMALCHREFFTGNIYIRG